MKFIRVQISDDLHKRLKGLTTHHGEFTHLIRKAIREFVTKEEQLYKEMRNGCDPTNISRTSS